VLFTVRDRFSSTVAGTEVPDSQPDGAIVLADAGDVQQIEGTTKSKDNDNPTLPNEVRPEIVSTLHV
jgi:hypothetical protein